MKIKIIKRIRKPSSWINN